MLHEKPFSQWCWQAMFTMSEFTLRPFLWNLSQLLSVYLPIKSEKHTFMTQLTWRLTLTPAYLGCIIILIIPASFAFLIRCILHHLRHPYILSVSENALNIYNKNGFHGNVYTVVSANLCLLPEFLSRLNNLNNTRMRSKSIGERIVIDQLHYPVMQDKEIKSRLVTHFPTVDFLCLQETWDRDYSKVLIAELHKIYPWILYDVGVTSVKSNCYMLNSGLMIASRYPILDADFKYYKDSCKLCVYSGKGLLMMKVRLSSSEDGDNVGYVFVTHMQAFQGLNSILDKQLDAVLTWTEEFRSETLQTTDKVLFDVVTGDFNFDNMSPGEKALSHHRLFSVYEDVCRESPGKDHDWTVGTEHRPMFLGEEQISTPERLRDALLDPKLRSRYMVDADIKVATKEVIDKTAPKVDQHGNPIVSPLSGKRRIDYVLYRKDNNVKVKNFSFVTRLAGLTDHIPVCLTFSTK